MIAPRLNAQWLFYRELGSILHGMERREVAGRVTPGVINLSGESARPAASLNLPAEPAVSHRSSRSPLPTQPRQDKQRGAAVPLFNNAWHRGTGRTLGAAGTRSHHCSTQPVGSTPASPGAHGSWTSRGSGWP